MGTFMSSAFAVIALNKDLSKSVYIKFSHGTLKCISYNFLLFTFFLPELQVAYMYINM